MFNQRGAPSTSVTAVCICTHPIIDVEGLICHQQTDRSKEGEQRCKEERQGGSREGEKEEGAERERERERERVSE